MIELLSDKKMSFEFLLGRVRDSYFIGKKTGTPKCCLFLGAGCSISSIGGAKDIIELCKSISFYNQKNNSKIEINKINTADLKIFREEKTNDFEIFESEINQKIANNLDNDKKNYIATIPEVFKLRDSKEDLWKKFRDFFLRDVQYGMWFEEFSDKPKDRQRLLESLIDDKKPRGEYIYLAHLIKESVFKNIFTTNFDDLINDALIHYVGIKPKVYAHNEIAKYIDFKGEKPNIIKLHGDYLFENIRNTIQETSSLADNMNEKLKGALANEELDIIVIGYKGADYSVMKCLHEAKGIYDFNLYWCGSKEENLHWRVKTLINNTRNSFFIQVSHFDEFIIESVNKLNIPYDYMKVSVKNESENKIIEIEKYQASIINNLPKDLKKNVERNLFRLSDDNFEKVNSIPTLEEKKKYLSRFQLEAIGRVIKNTYDFIDRSKAVVLYEYLDDGKFFQEQIKNSKTPIQYIGNTLCNLDTVDHNRTVNIFKSIDNEIYKRKFENANEGEILSALNELSSIDQDKTTDIGKLVNPKLSKELHDISLLEFTKPFTRAGRFIYIKDLNKYPDDFYLQKFKEEKSLKSVSIIMDRINSISPKKAQDILEIIPNENIIDKMKGTECSFKQIGIALKSFQGISPTKARIIFKDIPDQLLLEKIDSSSLRDIALAFSDLKDINRDKIHNIFVKHNDNFYVDLIHKTSFTEMGNALAKLRIINFRKTWHILDKVDKNNLVSKLDSETFKFEGFGAALLNLIKIEEDKPEKIFPDILKKSKILDKAESLSNDAKILNEQAFLTYFPFVIDMHEDLACEIVKQISNSKVFINLLQWTDLHKYTSQLPKFLKVFEKLGLTKEAENFASYICFNLEKLKTKYSDAEIELIKKVLRKYTTCN